MSCGVYADALNRLLKEGAVKTPAIDVLHGGLAMVEEGLNMQKRGDRGDRKLVFSMVSWGRWMIRSTS
jgi:hypothetical protein